MATEDNGEGPGEGNSLLSDRSRAATLGELGQAEGMWGPGSAAARRGVRPCH